MPDLPIGLVALQPEALSAFFGDIRSAMTQIQRSLDRLDPGGSRSTSLAEESDVASTPTEDTQEREIHEILNATPGNVVGNDEPENCPSPETIVQYKKRCTKHKRECEKMQVELVCYIAHLDIVEGDKYFIEKAESIRKGMLNPVQCVEKALEAGAHDRDQAFKDLNDAFDSLGTLIWYYLISLPDETALRDKIRHWYLCLLNGYSIEIRVRVNSGKFVECLSYIHDVFFSDLERAMANVAEAMMTFEEASAMKWLASQKPEDFEEKCEEYIEHVFPTEDSDSTSVSLDLDTNARLKERCTTYRTACNRMHDELDHLIAHYDIVGGDKEVIESAKLVQTYLCDPVELLISVLDSGLDGRPRRIKHLTYSLAQLSFAVSKFKGSLYHQKHAFYFREVKKWVDCLWNGVHTIHGYLHRNELVECMGYVCDDLFTKLEEAMDAPKEIKPCKRNPAKVDAGSVADELKTFGEKSLPTFLAEEKERDTTRYINITTIATFFSSVTATTLQFTYAQPDGEASGTLRGVVNFFWFLSLVFSVSSGVSSLLGVTWRRSSVYYSPRATPIFIRFWLDKAPMVFLIVAAVAFVVGLNLFAYWSVQPHFVSLATNVFTGLHSMCILSVTAWFIYQLKHESRWARWVFKNTKWIRTAMEWFGKGIGWFAKGMKWFGNCIKIVVRWIWSHLNWIGPTVAEHYDDYLKPILLPLLRNIYWAFGMDKRVGQLNYDLFWSDRYLSDPYLLSKLIRHIGVLTKKCVLRVKRCLLNFGHFVLQISSQSSQQGQRPGDIELGENKREAAEQTQDEPDLKTQAEEAKNRYRASLLSRFGEGNLVQQVMFDIGFWENVNLDDNRLERYLKLGLWGYPELYEEFNQKVRPMLALIREKNVADLAEEERSPERNVDLPRSQSRSKNQSEHGSVSGSPHRSMVNTSVPEGGSAAVEAGQPGTEPEFRRQPDDEASLSNEHSPSAAITGGPKLVDSIPSGPNREPEIPRREDDADTCNDRPAE